MIHVCSKKFHHNQRNISVEIDHFKSLSISAFGPSMGPITVEKKVEDTSSYAHSW